MHPQSLAWVDPLRLTRGVSDDHWVLLHSSAQTDYSGRYSYLACGLAERVECSSFAELSERIHSKSTNQFPMWFGYLGYGLKDSLEQLTPESPNWIDLSQSSFMRFHHVYVFDHEAQTLTLWSDGVGSLPSPSVHTTSTPPPLCDMRSPMSRAAYQQKVRAIIERIHAGDLYQANLTRKFIGTFHAAPDCFALFERLCAYSPAPYSAFLQLGNTAILSSSPERFLSITADGWMVARPIKGTAPRYTDLDKDIKSRQGLERSEKDRAENLMIVDLMRNDLSRCCEAGSVKTARLFDVTTHATIHHLSSTISGKKRPDYSTLEAVACCFPPGSMTGAPKITAMNLCAELEHLARGVYSGAIGWIGGDGSCDFSVVIRTLILQGRSFEFQVGGGIVADSDPEAEWEETLHKAAGIARALGIDPELLRAI